MSAIGNIGIYQHHQYISQTQNAHTVSNASEEANESPAEKAAEAKNQIPSTHVLDRYA